MRSMLLLTVPLVALGCAAPSVETSQKPHKTARARQSDALERADEDGEAPTGRRRSEEAEDAPAPSLDEVEPPVLPDADGDGVPDAADCAPASALEGARILEDDLAAATGAIAAAPGFDTSAWSHELGGFSQRRVRDAGDLALFKVPVGSAIVFEATASMNGSSKFRPRLRQVLLTIGVASSATNGIEAFGCGVEDVEGESAKMLASVVRIAGTAGAMTVSPIKRAAIAPIDPNVTFRIKARIADGAITCTIDSATTVVAENVGTVLGMAGLFTRQTSATFRQARICAVPGVPRVAR